MKEVESSNHQLVDIMEKVYNIVDTMTGFINESDETSKRMVSKYEESASNIDNIEEIIQGLMCELGIGGFMGIDDIKPGMWVRFRGEKWDISTLGEYSFKRTYLGLKASLSKGVSG